MNSRVLLKIQSENETSKKKSENDNSPFRCNRKYLNFAMRPWNHAGSNTGPPVLMLSGCLCDCQSGSNSTQRSIPVVSPQSEMHTAKTHTPSWARSSGDSQMLSHTFASIYIYIFSPYHPGSLMHSQMAAINGNNCSIMCGCIEHERVWCELCILLLPFVIVRRVCVRVCAPRPLASINHPPCAKSLSSRCVSSHQWRDEATAKLWSLSFGNWPSVIKKKF